MNRIKHIFTTDYLLGYPYNGLGFSGKIYFAAAVATLLLGIVCWVAARRAKNPIRKDFYYRVRAFGLTIGLLGLLWSFLRYERVYILSDMIVILVIYLIGLFWLVKILRYWLNGYKIKLDQFEKEQLKKKYL